MISPDVVLHAWSWSLCRHECCLSRRSQRKKTLIVCWRVQRRYLALKHFLHCIYFCNNMGSTYKTSLLLMTNTIKDTLANEVDLEGALIPLLSPGYSCWCWLWQLMRDLKPSEDGLAYGYRQHGQGGVDENHINGLDQDCINSIAITLELPQSCDKATIYICLIFYSKFSEILFIGSTTLWGSIGSGNGLAPKH